MTHPHRSEIFIDAPAEHVFRFFVDSDWLPRWLGVAARLDARPGGEFRFEVATGEWCIGEFLEVDPPRRVVFTWGWENPTMGVPPGSSVVEVGLFSEEGGTRLTLIHRDLPDESLAIHADGWLRYLPRLDRVVRGLDPGPDPAAETPEQVRGRRGTMSMSSVVEIERPAGEVFAFISDFSRNPEWQRGMKSAHWTTDPPLRVGSRYDQVAGFLGREVITSFEVTAYEPGRSVTIQSRESSFPITVTRTVMPADSNRSRVTAVISGEPGRFFRVFGPVLRIVAERAIRGDYQRLRRLLES